jgi:hypothetical protein
MHHRAKHEQTAFHFYTGSGELANSLETVKKREKIEFCGISREVVLPNFGTLIRTEILEYGP